MVSGRGFREDEYVEWCACVNHEKEPVLPERIENANLLLSFYGDDFTGSTDAMESLVRAGVETVLFVDSPTPELLAKFPRARAVGIAGASRTMSPEQMEAELTSAFNRLRALGAPVVHYKICSTFDSSPHIGSIGHAIDIGQRVIPGPYVPLIVGAPILGRYCAFGNLFARSGLDTAPYRLDRHPTMSRHPVTPMDEADLRCHLARQTECPIALIDVTTLDKIISDDLDKACGSTIEQLLQPALPNHDHQIVLFDTVTDRHLATVGQLVWELARQHGSNRQDSKQQGPLFVAGSSGVEYALTAHWQSTGLLAETTSSCSITPVDRVAVFSGSCSPVTERQIGWALDHGFVEIALDTPSLVDATTAKQAHVAAVDQAAQYLDAGQSVLLHTSLGPDDPRIARTRQRLHEPIDSAEKLGRALGRLARALVRRNDLKRIVFTGGDTSGYVARELTITALEYIGPIAPGSPLCLIHATDPVIDDVEITFKGGQVGRTEFFGQVLSCRDAEELT